MDSLNKIKLQVNDISKEYHKDSEVLKDINFSVYEGEFLSILGPSGCGKTTLLKILLGLDKPTSGSIYLNDRDITLNPASKRSMGMVFQNYALFQNMTVLQNVEYALKIKKDTKDIAREKAIETIRFMGMEEHIDKYPKQLSGGQQQRVAIARTLVLNPDIILFDEPMSALDVETRINLRKELKRVQKQFNTTMIYVTHDQEEAFALSDRIMVMQKSKIVQIDTPENIIANTENQFIQSFVVDNLRAKLESIQSYF